MGTNGENITKALFPGTKRKILALFLLNPDQEYYFSEVARLTGTRQGVVQRELRTLAEAGILNVVKKGPRKIYSVNRSNPIFSELRNIAFKTFGVIGQIQEAMKSLKKRIAIAFVYGSFARGEEAANSDVDLFIVGSADLKEIVSALADVETALGREINPTLFSEAELKKKFGQKNHFVRSIVSAEKEFVIGSEDEFRRLVEK